MILCGYATDMIELMVTTPMHGMCWLASVDHVKHYMFTMTEASPHIS